MDNFLHQHLYAAFIAFWLFSNAVATMPSPSSGGKLQNPFYIWIFSFMHAVAGSLPRIASTLAPNSMITKLIAPGSASAQTADKLNGAPPTL